ncbi:Hypothetical protein POVR1_LOCUS195 [uncultured virus]|nr:Hypothetical protein POVR1_LOCUS195 [uncultured virus]
MDQPYEKYAFRAECLPDVVAFLTQIKTPQGIPRCFTFEIEPPFPDAEVTFESRMSLIEIRELMETIPDSHVMIETLNYQKDYTGERYYDDY